MALREAFHRTARHRRPGAVAATLAWLTLVAPGAARAATIPVTTARDELKAPATCSLREAIEAAHDNDPVGGCPAGERDVVDTIELPFSVSLTIGGSGEDLNAGGDLDVDAATDGPWGGPVRIAGTGAKPSTIAQRAGDRVLDLVSGSLALEHVAVTGGRATGVGGGVLARKDTELSVTASLVSGNVAARGGGIANGTRMVEGGGGVVLVASSTVSANTATESSGGAAGAGGIANFDGTMTVVNSTVSGNATLGGRGGGVYNEATPGFEGLSSLSLVSSTIAANGPGAAGANVHNAGMRAPLRFRSTIVSDPRGGENCGSAGGGIRAIASQGYNLVDDADCNMTAPTDQPHADPLLGLLADNGGPVPTHALSPASPAVDRGTSDTALPGIGRLGSGQRGLPRPVDFSAIANAPGGDGTDVGAFELQRLPAAGPPAPRAERPSNRFRIVKVRTNRRRGTAVVAVRVPGPGTLALRRNRKVRPAAKHPTRARIVRLTVRPRGKAKRRLSAKRIRARGARRARIRVRARITYTPAGGAPRARTRKLWLVRRR